MSNYQCESCKETLDILAEMKRLNPIDLQAVKTMITLFEKYESQLPKELIAELSAIEVSP